MSTRYEAVRPLEPGRPVEIHEINEQGHLVGAWIGYWSYGRGTVALYPNVRNRFVNWPGGRVPSGKRIVSDRAVAVRSSARNEAPGKAGTSGSIGRADKLESDNGSPRNKNLPGQEKIRF